MTATNRQRPAPGCPAGPAPGVSRWAMRLQNASGEEACSSWAHRSRSIISVASSASTLTCRSSAWSGAAMRNSSRTGAPSGVSHASGGSSVMAASPGARTAVLLACGIARPLPTQVPPSASRASTSASKAAASARLPPPAIRSTSWWIASRMLPALRFRATRPGCSRSVICIGLSSFRRGVKRSITKKAVPPCGTALMCMPNQLSSVFSVSGSNRWILLVSIATTILSPRRDLEVGATRAIRFWPL